MEAAHPWQLTPPGKPLNYVTYRNPVNHEEFFQRAKRKLLLQQQQLMTTEQIAAQVTSSKMDRLTKMIADSKAASDQLKGVEIIYNPIPGIRTISNTFNPTPELTDAELELYSQAGGLPFSRKPTVRDYEEKPKELRLPVPDSERHYRIHFDENKLRTYQQIIMNGAEEETATVKSTKRTQVESFQTLMNVIKSLMKITTPSTPVESDTFDGDDLNNGQNSY